VLQYQPDHFNAAFGIGDIYKRLGEYEKAVQCYEKLLARQPEDTRLLASLAEVNKDSCQLDEAIQLYRKATGIDPGDAGLYSNYLLTLNYLEAGNIAEIAAIHREWGEYTGSSHPPRFVFEAPSNLKRLTIGFVSHDFRTHSVAYFFEPVVRHYDRTRFEFICYSNMANLLEDDTSRRIRNTVDRWRDITGLGDSAVADMIFGDGVDILFDLSGHTAWNRLPVFAMRPAPLQISWLGYPNTTGLKTMDYRLTDQVADPYGRNDALYTEKLLRLPNGFLSYLSPETAPDPVPPPVTVNRCITFGSFNALPKIGKNTIALWCRLLNTVPDSRLLLKNNSLASTLSRERLLARIAGHGIDPERVSLLPPSATIASHLAWYGSVDISLDTFPYNGTTTTCESLWMGVPVITLSGDTHVSRVSHSILHQLGLDWLVAESADQYIDIAATLAADVSGLVKLRTALRPLFAGSRLGQHEQFTREFEETLITAWSDYCSSPPGDVAPD
jgi:protein O-GlcNAc transferase